MKKYENLEEEFRSSQLYQTLSGSGSFVAEKVAQGLGKAAEGIDRAVKGAPPFPPGPNGSNGTPGGFPGPGNMPGPQPGGPFPGAGRPNPQNGPRPGQGMPPQGGPTGAPRPGGFPGTQSTRGTPGAPTGNGQSPQGGQPNGYYHYRYTPPQPPKQKARKTNYRQPFEGPMPPQQNAAYPHAGRAQNVKPVPPPKMKIVRRHSVAKYYITGVTALLYALTVPMTQPSHFIVFAIVEVLIFLLSAALFRGKKVFVPDEEAEKKTEAPPKEKPKEPEEAKPTRTGDPEVDKLIDEGNGYLKKLHEANDAIPDEALSDSIERMERASSDIFRYIAENPEKSSQIRKFMNYYLPTTLKLLDSYRKLSSQNVKGETVTNTMFNIAGMMHTVADAFEKQLDSLFSEEAMDISADITVFETLLRQEGYVGDKDPFSSDKEQEKTS